jgi:subtilase family serine protease
MRSKASMFFFEKKNLPRHVGLRPAATPFAKVFCFFFSKKKVFACLLFACTLIPGAASAAPHYILTGNTPRFLANAERLGTANPNEVIDVTLWFAPHNRADLDRRVAQEYNRNSRLYHHWLDRRTLGKIFGATDAEVAAVRDFLARSGLSVVGGDPGHFYLRARGTIAIVARAFHVEFADFAFRGRVYRANTADPVIDDAAGAYVAVVMGLDTTGFAHPLINQSDLFSTLLKQHASLAGPSTKPSGTGFNAVCFPGTTSENYTTDGAPPTATYAGNVYESGPTGCGYSPSQIAAAYGLDKLYAKGYDGTGQYIGIIDWCGSPTIFQDANAFAKRFKLPPFVLHSNLFIIDDQGEPNCAAPDPEINLDVEWAHAVAPGAAIQLFVALSATYQDILSSIIDALELSPSTIISNSYGSEEYYTGNSTVKMINFIIEAGASSGVALNFSSGDDGDFSHDGSVRSVSTPADSPYATAVGGVTLGLTTNGAIQFQAGWGNNDTSLAGYGGPNVPPFNVGFLYGSGGGQSQLFAKPAYQQSLPGTRRKVPDISWLADPFTGGIVALSVPGLAPELQYFVYGGTSLACPMFSGLWAIAQQAAGAQLGQAAPLLYAAPSGAITDILPVGSASNVTAVIYTGSRTIKLSANPIAQPLENTKTYISGLWNYPLQPALLDALTFGTDTGLVTGPGWDNVTGLGVANPVAFVTSLVPSAVK